MTQDDEWDSNFYLDGGCTLGGGDGGPDNTTISINIFFVIIFILKIIIIMPEQSDAASKEGEHAEKLHPASPTFSSKAFKAPPPKSFPSKALYSFMPPGTAGISGAQE